MEIVVKKKGKESKVMNGIMLALHFIAWVLIAAGVNIFTVQSGCWKFGVTSVTSSTKTVE
jgi:hypothetical protein